MTRSIAALTVMLSIFFSFSGKARANLMENHQGATNPTTEGFSLVNGGPVGVGGITGDMGLDAWQMVHSGGASSYYQSGALSAGEKALIASEGWTLSFRARVISDSSLVHNVFADLDTGSRRFGLTLGLDANGDTTALLVEQGSSPTDTQGQIVLLPGSGNQYRLFQLYFDPSSSTADFYIDGVQHISDYDGHSNFVGDRGVIWGTANGSHGHFNFVSLESGFTGAGRFVGDYNRNGVVDGADYVVWRKERGAPNTNSHADGNLDGDVDEEDYNIWRAHFGETAPANTASVAHIPEPPAIVLLAIISCLVIAIHSRKTRPCGGLFHAR